MHNKRVLDMQLLHEACAAAGMASGGGGARRGKAHMAVDMRGAAQQLKDLLRPRREARDKARALSVAMPGARQLVHPHPHLATGQPTTTSAKAASSQAYRTSPTARAPPHEPRRISPAALAPQH